MMKRICIVTGARPNFVKVAPLVAAARRSGRAVCQVVYAGCADDATLEPSLFSDLQMPAPDYYLGVGSESLNEITSRVMAEFDRFLTEHPQDVVIVVDDLASTMAAAIVTKKRGLRLAHIVAGTRSFDISMPKEINRLVTGALSDYLFTAGTRSTGVATREQAETSETHMVGNILMDTLRMNHSRLRRPLLDDSPGMAALLDGDYIVLTLNRRALLADEKALGTMLSRLMAQGTGGVPVIAPLRGMAAEVVDRVLTPEAVNAGFHIVKPLPYLEFGWLAAHAIGIITDSGNVAEEATFNGVPCITLNSYTEHIETVSQGSNVLVGEDCDQLVSYASRMVRREWKRCTLPDRWDGRTAERIVQVLTAEEMKGTRG